MAMNVLMTTDAVGGVWTYAMELAGALADHDVSVELATMGPAPSEEQRAQASELGNVRLHVSEYKLEWMDEPWKDVSAAGRWLLELERRVKPDVVHLNGYCHGQLDWSAPTVMVGHSCVLSWWSAVKHEPAPEAYKRYKRECGEGLRSANVVVAPTAAMLECLKQHYGPLARTRVIYNGRDASLFKPRRKEPFVFAAGRLWDEAKNLGALQQIAEDLPWPTVVAGDQRPPGGGASVSTKHVHALGRISQAKLAEQMGRAAIYALPARYEPFGLSVLEAALSGCALVLGDIASLREIWGPAAIYVPPNDPPRLRRMLETLIADRARQQALATKARNRALKLSSAKMAEEYVEAYAAARSPAAHAMAGESAEGSLLNDAVQ